MLPEYSIERWRTRIAADVMHPRVRALILIEHGALAHSAELVEALRERFDATMIVRRDASFASRRQLLLREIALLGRLLLLPSIYRRRTLLICSSGHYAALGAARALGAVGRETHVFLYNFYLHGLGQHRVVRRILSFLLTGRVGVAAQSPTDVDYFRSLSPAAAVELIPYGQDPVQGISIDDVVLGDYVFAGGYTNRDYDRLLRCARRLPHIRFVVACSRLNTIMEPVPNNVVLHRDLDRTTFHELLARARIVVVPLAEDVGSSGQMVTLAAMQLGKPLVVANSAVVTQYVEAGVSGLVYDLGSDASLTQTLEAAWSDETQLLGLAGAARDRYYSRFTKGSFDAALADALFGFADSHFGSRRQTSVRR
jgi:glycosyltransferase involved in cell wall biosynthesis